LVSSEQELTHLDSQLLLLIAAPPVLATAGELEAPAAAAPSNAFLEGTEGAGALGGEEGTEGAGARGGEEGAKDEEVARSLQGSHFEVFKNGRKDVGLKPSEIDDEPDRDAEPPIPVVGPVLCASTESSPTASEGEGDLDDKHDCVSSSRWPVPARDLCFGWLWFPPSRRSPPPPTLLWCCSIWREEVKMQKGRHAPSWRRR
jgi:hypothetical protein